MNFKGKEEEPAYDNFISIDEDDDEEPLHIIEKSSPPEKVKKLA